MARSRQQEIEIEDEEIRRRVTRACHARRDVPASESGSNDHIEENRCSKWRKHRGLG